MWLAAWKLVSNDAKRTVKAVFYVFVSVPLPSIFPLNRFFGEIEILFIFVGCNLIGFSDDDTTMVFDIDGGGGWYGGWRG